MKIAVQPVAEPVIVCSKCKVNPRADAESTNPWCNECRTKYQKEYMTMIARRSTDQAFNRGVAAMRGMLAAEFERHGSGSFSGYEIAYMIREATPPRQEIS